MRQIFLRDSSREREPVIRNAVELHAARTGLASRTTQSQRRDRVQMVEEWDLLG